MNFGCVEDYGERIGSGKRTMELDGFSEKAR